VCREYIDKNVIPDIDKRTIVIYILFYFRDENPVGPRGMLRVAITTFVLMCKRYFKLSQNSQKILFLTLNCYFSLRYIISNDLLLFVSYFCLLASVAYF